MNESWHAGLVGTYSGAKPNGGTTWRPARLHLQLLTLLPITDGHFFTRLDANRTHGDFSGLERSAVMQPGPQALHEAKQFNLFPVEMHIIPQLAHREYRELLGSEVCGSESDMFAAWTNDVWSKNNQADLTIASNPNPHNDTLPLWTPYLFLYIYSKYPSSCPSISSTLCHSTPVCLSFRLSICFFISVPSIIYPSVDLKIDSAVYQNVNHLHVHLWFRLVSPFSYIVENISQQHDTVWNGKSVQF